MGLFVFHLQGCRRGKQSQWLPSTNYIFRVAGSMPAPSCALQNVTGELWFLAAWTLPIWVEHDEISRRPSHPAYYCDLSLKGEKNESLGFLSARNSQSWMVSWGPELWQVPVEVSVFRAAGCERKHWFAFCVSLLVCVCRGIRGLSTLSSSLWRLFHSAGCDDGHWNLRLCSFPRDSVITLRPCIWMKTLAMHCFH